MSASDRAKRDERRADAFRTFVEGVPFWIDTQRRQCWASGYNAGYEAAMWEMEQQALIRVQYPMEWKTLDPETVAPEATMESDGGGWWSLVWNGHRCAGDSLSYASVRHHLRQQPKGSGPPAERPWQIRAGHLIYINGVLNLVHHATWIDSSGTLNLETTPTTADALMRGERS